MDKQKEKVLNQLHNIHSSLIDKEKFVPYNYNVLVMWGVISAILFLTFETVAKIDIWYSMGYIGIVIGVSFLVEMYFIKKENLKYDLEKFTKAQTFIETVYTFSVIFAILLTYILISSSLEVYAYLSWIFLLGFANFIAGFVLNNKKFTTVGIISISVAFAIFTISFLLSPLYFADNIKFISVLFSSGGLIYLGISVKKDYELV